MRFAQSKASCEPVRYTRELWFALVLAAALPAAAGAEVSGPGRPGPVVVDVRGRVAAGYAWGPWVSHGVEPEALLLWPAGRGIGLDFGYDVVGGSGGGMSVASVGIKYAAVRRRGRSPLCSKSGAGASLLFDSNGRIGARARLEVGFALLAARQIAFPIGGRGDGRGMRVGRRGIDDRAELGRRVGFRRQVAVCREVAMDTDRLFSHFRLMSRRGMA